MRTARFLLALVSAVLVAALMIPLRSKSWPLGVPGEWEWLRLGVGPDPLGVVLAVLAVLAYAGFAALGLRALTTRATPRREGLAVAALLGAATAVQGVVPSGAPEGYGLAKWALVLHLPASTGYYTVARREIGSAGRFLAAYPDWIRRQDALHIGTHPPGLFLAEHVLLRTFDSRPAAARWAVERMPPNVQAAFRAIEAFDPLPMADRATLGVSGALTLLACAATVVPLYALARSALPAQAAWSAAALWPLVPASVLFQPLPDTAYPLLATTALALSAHAPRAARPVGFVLALAGGLVLALGMALTLAFLAVGLIAALVLATAPGVGYRRRGALILATGAGFLAPTLAFWLASGANPFLIWWWNQANHARFYAEYPRTYRLWLLVNPIELALALGIPTTAWALVGFASTRVPRVAWVTLAVLVLLTLSGRNLSEVARLWLAFMPPLLTAAGAGLSRLGAGPGTIAFAVATLGAETLLLQATIQVVYPI